ncbi:MAG: hypothetical protein O7B99_01635 [Planctomycetota bacterium]|nr:hypothetical protein [Planctomycetota bacterium]
MRMVHYFAGMALMTTALLVLTAWSGIAHLGDGEAYDGENRHLSIGLIGSIVTVGTHTLVILFMIITGKVLKAAMESRPLPPSFLEELNGFFARKKAYPVAVLAATWITVVAVLGYGQRAFDIRPTVHLLLGLGAVVFNLWAFAIELRALRDNQDLLDRTAHELDRIDADRAARGDELAEPEELEEPADVAKRWLIVAASAWGPYLYWGVVEWGGDFGRVSTLFLVLTAVVSGGALLAAWRWAVASREQGTVPDE